MRIGRSMAVGAAVGGALGVAFALAVVAFADCGGPRCGYERAIGIVGHGLAGGTAGAALGLLAALLGRLVRAGRGAGDPGR